MNVIQPDSSLWKIVFLMLIVVVVIVFFGALGLSDTGILNLDRSRAEAYQLRGEADLAYQRGLIEMQPLTQVVQERAQAEIRHIRAEAAKDEALAAETVRLVVAHNNRILATRAWMNKGLVWLGLVLGIGSVLILLSIVWVAVHRQLDRMLPRQVIRPPVNDRPANFDPWRNPTYRSIRREDARRREKEFRAEQQGRRPPVIEIQRQNGGTRRSRQPRIPQR